jgi:hypothetical protein
VKECAQERVLNRIFGVLNASGDSVYDTKELRPLSFGERVETPWNGLSWRLLRGLTRLVREHSPMTWN